MSENNGHVDPFSQVVLPSPIYDHPIDDHTPNPDLTNLNVLNPKLPMSISPDNYHVNDIIPVLRRSHKTHKSPSSLKDFFFHTPNSIDNCLSYNDICSIQIFHHATLLSL